MRTNVVTLIIFGIALISICIVPVQADTVIPLCPAGTPFDANAYPQNTPQSNPMTFSCYWDGTGHVYISGDRNSVTGIYADDGYTVTIQPSGASFDAPEHWAHQHPVVELTSGMRPGTNTFTLVVQNWQGLSMSYGSITGIGTNQVPYIVQVVSGVPTTVPTTVPTLAQKPSMVQARVVPGTPLNGQTYVIHLLVNNPNPTSVPGSITATESTYLAGWDDTRIVSPYPNPELLTIPANGQADYTFQYQHRQHPFEPLELKAKSNGDAEVLEEILNFAPDITGLPMLQLWLETQTSDIMAKFGSRVQEIFDYTFTSNEISIPQNSYVPVIVDTPLYKKIALGDAIFSDICGSAFTLAAGPLPPNFDDLIESPGFCLAYPEFCAMKVYLLIAEVDHAYIGDQMENAALDPDINYTEPIQVQPILMPELDYGPDNPMKDLVLQYNATLPDAAGMREAFSKYNAAVDANDSVWQVTLLKECYRYESRLGDDFQALHAKAVPAMDYLRANGLQPTAADIEATKANISQNGLPAYEVTLLKRLGYSDLDIAAMKNFTMAVPNSYSVNYSETILDGLSLLQSDNAIELANLSDTLGPDAPPYADFTVSNTTGRVPLAVSFTDTSIREPGQWAWDFGDGSSATMQNPVHTYKVSGTYTVTLTVTNATTGEDTRTMYDLITATAPTPPVANFTANATSGKVLLTVQFNDTSTNTPTAWHWEFGDGTNDTVQNPVHIYTAAGNYTVGLLAKNDDGIGNLTLVDYISALAQTPPVADFTANVTTGKIPLAIQFNDTSANTPTAWHWEFGDGTNDTVQNPVHTYMAAGTYTVRLLAKNDDGIGNLTRADYISVLPTVPPIPDFTASPVYGKVPLTVRFSDNSTNTPTAWHWEFGDGTNDTEQNPVHTYTAAGNYTVELFAKNNDGYNSITKPDYIRVQPFNPPVPDFTGTPVSGHVPLTVSFSGFSNGGVTDSWSWDFGDGSAGTGQAPVHIYTAAGTYTVTLYAANADGNISSVKPGYITAQAVPAPVAGFTANITSGNAPLMVRFSDLSTNQPTSWSWDFGDGYISSLQNPVHEYDVSGNYTVTLTATNAGGNSTAAMPGYIAVIQPPDPQALIDQLIIYIRNQNNVPGLFQDIMVAELAGAKGSLWQHHPDDAVIDMKVFEATVNLFTGWPLTGNQASTMQGSAAAIIKAINLPVNQRAIDQTKALTAEVKSLNLPASLQASLVAELDLAEINLEATKNTTAVSALNLFIGSVNAQDGKQIPHATAVRLVSEAQGIIQIVQ